MSFIPTYYEAELPLNMELVPLPQEYMFMPYAQPMPAPAPATGLCRSALKSTSLSRMEELHVHLCMCDDPTYAKCYTKLLKSCPHEVVEEFANQLRTRAQYLAYEEQREYKRGKLLNVLGGGQAPVATTDADAFCTRVLGEEEDLQLHLQHDLENKTSENQGGSGLGGGIEHVTPAVGLAALEGVLASSLLPSHTGREGSVETNGSEQENAGPPALAAHQLLKVTPLVEQEGSPNKEASAAATAQKAGPSKGGVAASMTGALKRKRG